MKQTKEVHPYAGQWHEYKQEVERAVIVPLLNGKISLSVLQGLFSRFGVWESMVELVENSIIDEQYYQNQVESLESEKDELDDTVSDMKKSIQDVVDDLESIPYNEDDKALNDTIAECIKNLEKLT